MTTHDKKPVLLWFCLVVAVCPHGFAQDEGAAWFSKTIRPLLEKHCFECHGGGRKVKAGLNLTHRKGLLRGGDNGPVFSKDPPKSNLLLEMISYKDEDHQMPPRGKLAGHEIQLLKRWIEAGAPYDGAGAPPMDPDHEAGKKKGRGDGLAGWSYKPIRRLDPPRVRNAEWVTNPIDSFVKARLDAAGLEPAVTADRISLIRRATYDLTGLPPTPREVDTFLADNRPDAFARVVDRLLESSHYGERWARHWLDLVRYAETNGYERDSDKPQIWRYRDYVINAFNADKPMDRFFVEQLAGDELDVVTPETLTATAYYRLMIWDDEPGQGVYQARYDTLADIVSTTSQAFLGMSLGCARCHDHKVDPIPQADFYRFMDFFHGITDMSKTNYLVDVSLPEMKEAYRQAEVEKAANVDRLQGAVSRMEDDLRRRAFAADRKKGPAQRSDLVDVRYRFYRDTWDRLPDFDALLPEDTGSLPAGLFDLSPATRRESVGFVFDGRLRVQQEGRYEFFVDTAQPVRLKVGRKIVIAPDAPRHGRLARGAVTLPLGYQSVRLDYFNRGANERGLKVWWRRVPGRDWRYTTEKPPDGWEQPRFDDGSWTQGPAGFGRPETPSSVVGTVWNSRDIWIRRRFDWDGDPGDLRLAVHHDDNIQVHINGVPAAEAKGYVTNYFFLDISEAARRTIRKEGNTITVHCSQDFGGQYVHVEPVSRVDSEGVAVVDAAFARHPLSFEGAARIYGDINRLMNERGAKLLDEEGVARYRELKKELDGARRVSLPERVMAPAVQERRGRIPDLHVHARGNAESKGAVVAPGFPTPAVSGTTGTPDIPKNPAGSESSGRRRVLAEWIVADENPLTARVLVNRIWQHHFGRGIVRSTNDFGELGNRPTHPALLDWLATELVRRNWSMKDMHRLIMSSSTYRMSSTSDPRCLERDPGNDLMWRFEMRRLGAEELRDSVIAVTGKLNRRLGGRSFFSAIPKAALATSSRPNAVWGRSSEEDMRRRSVYIKVKRSLATPLLSSFDVADTDQSCPVRFITTHPGQSLSMMNGNFLNKQAGIFAKRLQADAPGNPAAQIRLAHKLCFGRVASGDEVRDHLAFMQELQEDFGLDQGQSLEQLCLLVLNLNEFVYLD